MKIALAQINTTVGDLPGNEAAMLAAYQRGVAAGVDLVMFPELTTTGYPPRDLLLREDFATSVLFDMMLSSINISESRSAAAWSIRAAAR